MTSQNEVGCEALSYSRSMTSEPLTDKAAQRKTDERATVEPEFGTSERVNRYSCEGRSALTEKEAHVH